MKPNRGQFMEEFTKISIFTSMEFKYFFKNIIIESRYYNECHKLSVNSIWN